MSLENLAKMDQQWYYLNSNFLNNQLSRIISTILTMAPLMVRTCNMFLEFDSYFNVIWVIN